VIGEALAAACGDRAVLARIGGPIGAAARAALERLERLEHTGGAPARRRLRAGWAAAARAPVPPGLRGVHPSWIEATLAELPPRARADLAGGGLGTAAGTAAGSPGASAGAPAGAPDPVAVWLVRRACAGLPPLPVADAAGPPASIDEAVRLRGDALEAWLVEIGADQLALAVGAAGGEALAAAVRVVGARLARAAARIGGPPRVGALGPVRAAIARCKAAVAELQGGGPLDDRALLAIGARAIAPHACALARRQLAVRLPRPLGLAAADALAAFAQAPIAQAPAWRALAATY
jgi:hypothetical protein